MGEYLAVRTWEIQTMTKLGLREEEYGKIPLEERARLVCGTKLPEWMGVLETERHREEIGKK